MGIQARQAVQAGLLLGLLLASGTGRADEPSRIPLPPATPAMRAIFLSGVSEVPEIYVAVGVVVTLLFEKPCDPARTKLLGGEESFRPVLVSDDTVTLRALHEISPLDRFRLLVTFSDGTQQPLTITAHDFRVDHQVLICADPNGLQALQWRVADSKRREWRLGVENERLRQEALSPDHAFATLLVAGAENQISFVPAVSSQVRVYDRDKLGTDVRVHKRDGKAAVVFRIANKDVRSWKLLEVRLSVASSGELRLFAMRMDRTEIPPGAKGTLAVVVDRSAFVSANRHVPLLLKLYRHDGRDGVQQAAILLEPWLVSRAP